MAVYFGVVYKAKNLSNGELWAVKTIPKQGLTESGSNELKEESKILCEMDHPNILEIYDLYEDKEHIRIVTEYLDGGSLATEVKRRKEITEKDVATIICQVLDALAYCHSNNIAHKDIKCDNIMLGKRRSFEYVKIIDFGLAEKFENGRSMKLIAGTPYYMAPEVLKGSYDEKCDVWSVGVLMYYLLSGSFPFDWRDRFEVWRKIERWEFTFEHDKWEFISEEAQDLIKRMLTVDKDKRISAEDALKDEWFAKFRNEEIDNRRLSISFRHSKKFTVNNEIQRVVLSYMVKHMTKPEDTKNLDKVFRALDTDHSGKLSLGEFIEGVRKVFPKMSVDSAVKLFKKCDVDGSGEIGYTEWVICAINKARLLSNKNLKAVFNVIDEDKNGKISLDEARSKVAFKITETDWKNIIKEFDENNDNEIDFEEFKNIMSYKPAK